MNIGNGNKFSIGKGRFPTQENLNQNKSSLQISKSKESQASDTVSISNEAKLLFSEGEALFPDNGEIKEIDEVVEELEHLSNKTGSPLDTLIKCVVIAGRIIKGDRVPINDMKFLAENEPKLYSNAILLRQEKSKPKKHEGLIEEEKENPIRFNNELKDLVQELIESKDIEALSGGQE